LYFGGLFHGKSTPETRRQPQPQNEPDAPEFDQSADEAHDRRRRAAPPFKLRRACRTDNTTPLGEDVASNAETTPRTTVKAASLHHRHCSQEDIIGLH